MVINIIMSSNNRILSFVGYDLEPIMPFPELLNRKTDPTIFTFTNPVLIMDQFHIQDHACMFVNDDYRISAPNSMELVRNVKNLIV